MAALVLRRGELLRKHPAGDGSPWQRCWMKMYSDRAVDHNNSKVFDVPSIQAVAKTSTSDTIVEFAVTTTGGTRLVFQAPSVQECDAWVRCITDAKRICLASNGRMLFQQAHNVASSSSSTARTSSPFVRFDDSASSYGSDDDEDDDDDDSDERTIVSAANSPVKSPLREPVPTPSFPTSGMSRSNAGTFTILHGYINLPNGS
ncbi:hypothetical protein AaE_000991, partial [Aphanomyces astaci]